MHSPKLSSNRWKVSSALSPLYQQRRRLTAAARDMRLAFIGDSFVAGAGDDTFQGWPGRLGASMRQWGDREVTIYNLGVRRNTSTDITRRWEGEVDARLRQHESYDGHLVFSFGVNDCVSEDGRLRVHEDTSVANAKAIFARAAEKFPTLVVGPPPSTTFGDVEFNHRILAMEEHLQRVVESLEVPFLPIARQLMQNEVWCREAAEGDGIHPGRGGYEAIAQAVQDWHAWQRLFQP